MTESQHSFAEQTIAYPIRDNLYLNLTDKCTLRCRFCPKYNGSHRVQEFDLSLHHKPHTQEVINAIEAHGNVQQFNEVVYCGYGEPTLRLKDLLATAAYIKNKGGRVRLNTDGLANLVHKRNVLPELSQYIDAMSVSMNAQNAAVYNQHCRPAVAGSYPAMLDFLKQAPLYIGDVTATAINGLEGVDIEQCAALAKQLGVKFRTRQLDIVG
jgi:TatD family-associated radical SAM protein